MREVIDYTYTTIRTEFIGNSVSAVQISEYTCSYYDGGTTVDYHVTRSADTKYGIRAIDATAPTYDIAVQAASRMHRRGLAIIRSLENAN